MKKVVVSIYMLEDLKKALAELAKQEKRTVSSQICKILEDALSK